MDEYKNLRLDIKSVLSEITEQNVQGMLKYEEIGAHVEDAKLTQEELYSEQEIVKEHFHNKQDRAKELEEM